MTPGRAHAQRRPHRARALAPVGGLAVTTHEQPSASLLVDVAPGSYVKQDGSIGSYAGVSGQAITLSTTKSLYLDGTASWALVVGSSFPATPHVRLATVVAGDDHHLGDRRAQCFPVAGSIADGVNLAFGTTTGTQLGTATSQKLGFYGKTPIVQPTIGAATASGSYTSVEQGMLQAVHDAVRALGLGG